MPEQKPKVTQLIDGVTYTEGYLCPHCDCDTMAENGKLVCSGCGLPIDESNWDSCNFDNGHNCDDCDPEYCHECGDYSVGDDGKCENCDTEEDKDE